jgi:hypothetical protein
LTIRALAAAGAIALAVVTAPTLAGSTGGGEPPTINVQAIFDHFSFFTS